MSVADDVRKALDSLSASERQKVLKELRSVMLDAMYRMERESADSDVKCCRDAGASKSSGRARRGTAASATSATDAAGRSASARAASSA